MRSKSSRAPDEVDIFVGSKIKEVRRLKQMSQSELGVGVGVTFQQCQKWENGSNRITVGRLVAVAKALGVPVMDLLPPVGRP